MSTVTSNTSRNRQADYRRRMEAAGFVQVTGWVHTHQAASVTDLLAALRADINCEAGPMRDIITGRLTKVGK